MINPKAKNLSLAEDLLLDHTLIKTNMTKLSGLSYAIAYKFKKVRLLFSKSYLRELSYSNFIFLSLQIRFT